MMRRNSIIFVSIWLLIYLVRFMDKAKKKPIVFFALLFTSHDGAGYIHWRRYMCMYSIPFIENIQSEMYCDYIMKATIHGDLAYFSSGAQFSFSFLQLMYPYVNGIHSFPLNETLFNVVSFDQISDNLWPVYQSVQVVSTKVMFTLHLNGFEWEIEYIKKKYRI